ncbi:DUF4197 domain-containing protein [Robiginitomaculum antarcticum]|uniref:DUF4197 domain-containing protein n=1 Tax=Robiginitomaculum antarcticum TaxID=437507 RepID=UPI0003757CF7|nr:DUF4197 domain-containing protein [Robiginitomaculum antarcticum]
MTVTFDRRLLLASLAALPLSACETIDPGVIDGIIRGTGGGGLGISQAEAAGGIRAALEKGITTAVQTVGRTGGYLNDGQIRIPLPNSLQDIQQTLGQFGLSGLLDEIETQLNRGAEAAAPLARDMFVDVIMGLSITDAINIVRGADNAATQYLADKTLPRLTDLFTPIIDNALSGTGAYRLVDDLTAQIPQVPFAPQLAADAKSDLTRKGVEGGLDGLFYYIGKQEAAIRANPLERTSEILRRVFGGYV